MLLGIGTGRINTFPAEAESSLLWATFPFT